MKKFYSAIVEGKKRKVKGFDAKNNLILSDAIYAFERLDPNDRPRDEPAGEIFGLTLLEVVRLQPWQGDWKWNDETKTLSEKLNEYPKQSLEDVKIFSRFIVKGKLDELKQNQNKVTGIAWFQCGDDAGGRETPILLKNFRKLVGSTLVKPVARIKEDFSMAYVPRGVREEMPITIEPELGSLIKKIVDAGGSLPRTKLREHKPAFRPEKLFESKNAKKLIKARLIGVTKNGRTRVFWAKKSIS